MRLLHIAALFLLASCSAHNIAAEKAAVARFQAVGDNIVYDSQTGLMWASKDNGKDIDWYDAERYCKDFKAGGYADWRLPEIDELATLYTQERKNKDGFAIIDLVTITDCCLWSADTNMGGADIFSYKTGKKPAGFLADTYQLRVLPVRSHKKIESVKNKVVVSGAHSE